MAGLRHFRKVKSRPENASQRTVSGSTNSTSHLTQSDANLSHTTSEKHRGRRKRTTVQLRIPPRGRKVGLEPQGDRQFKYKGYHSKDYKYTTQLVATSIKATIYELLIYLKHIVAQNRGGSRPFVETQQYLAEKFGPEKATTLNTYFAMKCGVKNVCSSGNNSSTISKKAQERIDTYSSLAKEKYPDDWEERELDGEILYEASGGIPHGRVSIADGAVKKAAIIPSAKERNVRASYSLTLREKEQLRRSNEENAQLRRTNEMLQQKQEMHGQLIITLFKEIGKEVPADILGQLTGVQQGTTNSHAGSQAVDGNTDGGDSIEGNDANNSNDNIGDDAIDMANLGSN